MVVHGGGKAITRAMEKAGLKADFIQGQRVTDEATAKIVDEVLSREINPEIVKTINELGGKAVGFAGPDIFKCRKLWLDDKENPGKKIDIGYVGEVVEVNTAPLQGIHLVRFHAGHQPDGARRGRENLQLQCGRGGGASRHCAEGEAARVHERRARLVARSETARLGHSPLKTSEVDALKKSGVIDKGMIPKVDSAVAAIHPASKKFRSWTAACRTPSCWKFSPTKASARKSFCKPPDLILN